MSSVLTDNEVQQGLKLNGPDDNALVGWFCIQLNQPPECARCGTPITYAEPDDVHKILVWEENDDDTILKAATSFRNDGFNPKIIEYDPKFGVCETFTKALARGKAKWVTQTR